MGTKVFYLPQRDNNVTRLLAAAEWKTTSDISKSFDAVLFTGGEDVTPFLYGEAKHSTTYNNIIRDMKEIELLRDLDHYFPKVGICRGGQFLNVMSGGRMYQDVGGHTKPHDIKVFATGEIVRATSTHHQMMIPDPEVSQAIAGANLASYKSTPTRTISYKDAKARAAAYDDAEVVYYWNTNSLCYQPHPEYQEATKENKALFLDLVEYYAFIAKPVKPGETDEADLVECG